MNGLVCYDYIPSSVQSVSHLSPRVLFSLTWLVAILSLLFSALQNVLPRSYYSCSLPKGQKLLYTAERSLCGYVSPFVMKLHSNAYFWEFPFAQLFLQTNRWTFMAKVRNITEQNMQASFILIFTNTSLLFAHFDVHSRVWVCMGSAPRCQTVLPVCSEHLKSHLFCCRCREQSCCFPASCWILEVWAFLRRLGEPCNTTAVNWQIGFTSLSFMGFCLPLFPCASTLHP